MEDLLEGEHRWLVYYALVMLILIAGMFGREQFVYGHLLDKTLFHFGRKFLLFVSVILVSYLALLYLELTHSADTNSYVSAQIDKIELPQDDAVSSSDPHWGIECGNWIYSAELSRSFDMPVINMGLLAGFGLKYMLDSADPLLKTGDIVVISPEYHQFENDMFSGSTSLVQLFGVTRDPTLLRRLTPSSFSRVTSRFFNGSQ